MSEPLEILRALEPTYQPLGHAAEAISEKNLIGFIGAFAVGKTTLIETIARNHDSYSEVMSFTTRPTRGHGDNYRFLVHGHDTLAELATKAERGELVNMAVHPTTGYVYGTEAEDYKTQNCMLATTSKSYESDKNLPFASVKAVVVVAQPKAWIERISKRVSTPEERKARIREAQLSLEWSLDQSDVMYVDNTSSSIVATTDAVVNFLEEFSPESRVNRKLAQAMLVACNV